VLQELYGLQNIWVVHLLKAEKVRFIRVFEVSQKNWIGEGKRLCKLD